MTKRKRRIRFPMTERFLICEPIRIRLGDLLDVTVNVCFRWAMDHALISRVKDVQTFIDFKDKPPKRCLDLGTMVRSFLSTRLCRTYQYSVNTAW